MDATSPPTPPPSPRPCGKCGEAWFLSYTSTGAAKFCGVCSAYDKGRVKSRWTLRGSQGAYEVVDIAKAAAECDAARRRNLAPQYNNDAPLPEIVVLDLMDDADSGMTKAERRKEVAQYRLATYGPSMASTPPQSSRRPPTKTATTEPPARSGSARRLFE